MTKSKATTERYPVAPRRLSAEARKWWSVLVREYQFSDGELLTLEITLQALDRLREVQAILKAEGLTVSGERGDRAHPLLGVERDARLAVLRGVKDMKLPVDLERPPGKLNGRPRLERPRGIVKRTC